MRQIAVIGLGNFGRHLALALIEEGAQVFAVDSNRERVEELKDRVTYAARMDATDENALRATNINEVDAAVVCIGKGIEANLLSSLLLRKIGVKKVLSRAISPLQQDILRALEVDQVINLEEEMGQLTARGLVRENVVKHVKISEDYSVAEINIPPGLVGKSLREAKLRSRYGLNVVAIRRTGSEGKKTSEETVIKLPDPGEPLQEKDVLVLVGGEDEITRFSSA